MSAYRKSSNVPIYPKEPEKVELTPAQIRHKARNKAVACLLGIIAAATAVADGIVAVWSHVEGSWPYLIGPSLALLVTFGIALRMSPSFPESK